MKFIKIRNSRKLHNQSCSIKDGIGNSIDSMVCRFFAGDCCQEKENRGFYVILEDMSDCYQMPDLDKGLSDKVI